MKSTCCEKCIHSTKDLQKGIYQGWCKDVKCSCHTEQTATFIDPKQTEDNRFVGERARKAYQMGYDEGVAAERERLKREIAGLRDEEIICYCHKERKIHFTCIGKIYNSALNEVLALLEKK